MIPAVGTDAYGVWRKTSAEKAALVEAAAASLRDAEMERHRLVEGARARLEADQQAVVGRHPILIIIDEVALKHGVVATDLIGKSMVKCLAPARQEAMWRARHETDLSLPAIGRRFGGRNHATILHGIRQHQKRIDAASRSMDVADLSQPHGAHP